MARVKFDVTGAALSSRLKHDKAEWQVTFQLAPPFDEHITLASGEDIRTAQIALTIKAMTTEHDRWLQDRQSEPDRPIIGQMHYFDGPFAILSDAYVSSEAFDRLLDLTQAGRLASSLTIEVQNLKYDWRPDGSGKVWDNRAQAIVPVTDISFEVPIGGSAKESEPDRMSELAKLARESITLQRWTLGALIVAVLALALSR